MTATVLSLPEIVAAENVLAYASFGSEAPTQVLLEKIWSSHGTVLLPYLEDGEIKVARVARDDPMIRSGYGPKEPSQREPVELSQIEATIVPGLGFDPQGHRLGYGRGFYDRLLAKLAPTAVAIGFGFAEQLVERIPTELHDVALNALVTDEGYVRIAPQLGRSS